jgi:hypothetical protein
MSYLDHAYMKKLMKLVAEGKLRPGDLVHVDIHHGPRCPFLRGRVCTCDPDIRVRPDAGDDLGDRSIN